MRYLGTLMILACAGMLLFPLWWERRDAAEHIAAEAPASPPGSFPGRSTLRGEDLLPEWRGPGGGDGGDKDG